MCKVCACPLSIIFFFLGSSSFFFFPNTKAMQGAVCGMLILLLFFLYSFSVIIELVFAFLFFVEGGYFFTFLKTKWQERTFKKLICIIMMSSATVEGVRIINPLAKLLWLYKGNFVCPRSVFALLNVTIVLSWLDCRFMLQWDKLLGMSVTSQEDLKPFWNCSAYLKVQRVKHTSELLCRLIQDTELRKINLFLKPLFLIFFLKILLSNFK